MSSGFFFGDDNANPSLNDIATRRALAQMLLQRNEATGQYGGLANAGNEILGALLLRQANRQDTGSYQNQLAAMLGANQPNTVNVTPQVTMDASGNINRASPESYQQPASSFETGTLGLPEDHAKLLASMLQNETPEVGRQQLGNIVNTLIQPHGVDIRELSNGTLQRFDKLTGNPIGDPFGPPKLQEFDPTKTYAVPSAGGGNNQPLPSSPPDVPAPPRPATPPPQNAPVTAMPEYTPAKIASLVTFDNSGTGNAGHLNFTPEFGARLQAMLAEYNAKTGLKPQFNSGSRSAEEQAALIRAGYPAAPVGKSRHQQGDAADFNSSDVARMDQLGLFDKYGLMHLSGGEYHHVQLAPNAAPIASPAQPAPAAPVRLASNAPTIPGYNIISQGHPAWRTITDPKEAQQFGVNVGSQINTVTGETKPLSSSSMPIAANDPGIAAAGAMLATTGTMGNIGRDVATQRAVRESAVQYLMQHNPGMTPEDAGMRIATNEIEFKAKGQALGQFLGKGPGSRGGAITAANNAIGHMQQLANLARALGSGNYQLINQANQAWQQATGGPPITNYNALLQVVGPEIIKAIVPGGGGEGERTAAQNTIAARGSPQQIAGALDTYSHALARQLYGQALAYKAAGLGNENDFATRFLAPDVQPLFRSALPQAGGGTKVGRFHVQEVH